MAEGFSLGALVDAIPDAPDQTVNIDISELLGKPENTAVVTLRKLDVARMHQRHADAALVKKAHPQWPYSLCLTVATLALAHVSPAPAPDEAPIGVLYARMAETGKSIAVWAQLETTYARAFPDLFGIKEYDEAVADEKND